MGDSDVKRLRIRRFDMSSIASDKVVVMLGKRNTGKSVLVQDLLYYHRDIPIGTVISKTESATSFYGAIIPHVFIHDTPNPAIVTNAIKRQRLLRRKMNAEERERRRPSTIDNRAFLVLDDCLAGGKEWVRHKSIEEVFMNGRHWNLLAVITLQYPVGIPPNLRGNIDYVFILRNNIATERKKIYQHYAGIFESQYEFDQVMDQCTENYGCLVIDLSAKTNRLEDCVFWYRAEPHEAFRLGAPYFWSLASSLDADVEAEEEEDSVAAAASRSTRRKGPTIAVVREDAGI